MIFYLHHLLGRWSIIWCFRMFFRWVVKKNTNEYTIVPWILWDWLIWIYITLGSTKITNYESWNLKIGGYADLLPLSRKKSLLESISCTLRSSIEALFSKSGMRKRFWSNKKRLTRGSVNPGSQENYLQALGYIRSKFCVARLVPNFAGSSQYTLLEQRILSGTEFTCMWPNLHVESLYPPDIQTSIASV